MAGRNFGMQGKAAWGFRLGHENLFPISRIFYNKGVRHHVTSAYQLCLGTNPLFIFIQDRIVSHQ
jgi:hypothetical protein